MAGGTTVLLTTQYLDEADRLADRIAVIDHGAGDRRGHAGRAQGAGRRRAARDPPRATGSAARRPSRRSRRSRDGRPVVRGRLGPRPARASGAARSPRRCGGSTRPGSRSTTSRSARPTLDDVFLTLTGHAAEDGGGASEPTACSYAVSDTLVLAKRSLQRIRRQPDLLRRLHGAAGHVRAAVRLRLRRRDRRRASTTSTS